MNKLRLSGCKTIEIRNKNARFKSSNLTGELKGYLFQLTKLWEELVVLTATLKNATKPKEETKSNLENGKLCPNTDIRILLLLYFFLFFFTCVFL